MATTLTAPALVFEPIAHAYVYNGQRVDPSVTELLRVMGLSADWSKVPADILNHKRDLGRAVHAACHYDDEGTLDETTVDPAIVPYVEAWRAYRRDTNFQPLILETPLYAPAYGFCGTPDRVGIIDGYTGYCQCDLKTGDPEDAGCAYQTGAYDYLLRANWEWLAEQHGLEHRLPSDLYTVRFSVQLKPNGTYKLREYTNYRDWSVFLAALTTYRNLHPSRRTRE